MKIQPLFIDAGGVTIRINPRPTKTSYVRLQIMEPPQYTGEQGDVIFREGKFTEIWLEPDQAKAVADGLYTESMSEYIENNPLE